jgi:hypothetical protein
MPRASWPGVTVAAGFGAAPLFGDAFSCYTRVMTKTVAIERVAHIGVRVRDLDRALSFYRLLGFMLSRRAEGDDVAIIRNPQGVEINLIFKCQCW